MEDSTSSSGSPQNASATETVIITPSQLEKMGLIVRTKDSSKSQEPKTIGNEPESRTSPEVQKEFKIDPTKIKSKLCTLLNHTPLVMQVKNVNWMAQERKDKPVSCQIEKEGIVVEDSDDDDANNRGDDEQDEVPKFKIVSDEKSNLSAVEIENMLSSAKMMKSDHAISSPLQKHRIEEVVKNKKDVNEWQTKNSQSTSKESTNDAGILKKECLKRIQAKMYENLKKVLNEVDSLPLKDKACLNLKPLMVTNMEDSKTIISKPSDMAKATEKAKENKPCYMSVYRERKTSQDAEKMKEEVTIEIDTAPETQHNKPKINRIITNINNGDEVIKIDDESDDIVRIPKKRKRPPPEAVELYRITDEAKGTVIEIADNEGAEERRKDNKPLKKSIVSQFYRNVQDIERKKSPLPQVYKVKRPAKMINTSKSPKQISPRRRGRPRKIPKVETISIVVEEIDDSEAEKEVLEKEVSENAEISSSNSSKLPPRKRGRPPKNKNQQTPGNTQTPKPSLTPQIPESDAVQTESNLEDTKLEESPETTPAARKRGRPRKIHRDITENAGKSSSSTEKPTGSETKSERSESQDNNNTPVEVKVHKKRGRKSKAELAALRKNEQVEEVIKDKYAESRTSGRKRKVIDYNMLNGEDSDVEERELKMQKGVSSYGRVIRRSQLYKTRHTISNDEDEASDSSDHKRTESESSDEDAGDRNDDDGDESADGKELEKSDDKDEKGNEVDEDHEREETEAEELEDAKRSQDILPKKRRKTINEDILVEDKPDEEKKLKHKEKNLKHDEKEDDDAEKEDDYDEKDNLQPPKEELESEDIPEPKTELKEDEVRCAICEEVVQQDSWSHHKRKFHNDLAWFSGEQSLNLDDTALVEEKLNAILSEDGVLKCVACDIQTDSVESFVQHKKDCKMCIAKNKTYDTAESGVKGRKKRKPGGASEVLSYLFTNFAKNLKDEPSENNDDVVEHEVKKVESKDDLVPQEDQPVLKKDQTQCAICLKVLPKANWFNHKLTVHNNLAWRIGDTPLDLSDKSLVVKILHELYLKRKPLYCDVCGGTRKSVMGFLSHKSQCKKSNKELADMKVKCNLCNRKMLLVSMSRHMVLSHSGDPVVEEQPAKDMKEDISGKRKAANRAFQLIRNLKEEDSAKIKDVLKGIRFRSVDEVITKFNVDIQRLGETTCVYDNCAYVATETEDLLQHMEDCTERCNEGYTCNFCLATFQYKRSATEHILAMHPDDDKDNLVIQEKPSDEETAKLKDEDVSDPDDEFIYQARTPSKLQKRNQQHPNVVRFLAHLKKKIVNCCYPSAYKWTLDYHKENYTAESLFPNVLCDERVWTRLDNSRVLECLPKLKRSIDIATLKLDRINIPCKQDYQWTSYKLFQSTMDADGTSTIFCGGPVSALAWVPIPYNQRNMDQILAVSVLPDPDEKYYGTKIYRRKGMIQFWNHGVLKNKSKPDNAPKLEFCLVHDYGIVWCMEWCPSGCYDSQEDAQPVKRLGLLAMACSDSNVYICTVPKPAIFSGKIFQPKPSFKLILDGSIDLDLGELTYHATKLSWSKASGHSYLAVGYSNGMIGIFNLNAESKLLSETIDGVVVLKPTHAFKAHNDVVTALVLHHMDKGNRWLISGSLDRESKMWDLRNTSEPLNNIKKYIITDGIWVMHWLCPIYTFQHSTVFGAVPSGLIPARGYNGTMSTFLPTNSRTTCLSGSDWGNLFLQANDCGEVVCGFPDQLLYGFENDKRRMIRRCRMLASYTAYVAKNLTPEERLKKEETKVKVLNKKIKWNDLGGMSLSEPKSYNEACESYGIVFCDMDKTTQHKDPTLELDKLLQSPPFHSMSKPDMYPLQSINKIVQNPNKNSYLFYACGYQVGFVRTSSLMFLNNNQNAQ